MHGRWVNAVQTSMAGAEIESNIGPGHPNVRWEVPGVGYLTFGLPSRRTNCRFVHHRMGGYNSMVRNSKMSGRALICSH